MTYKAPYATSWRPEIAFLRNFPGGGGRRGEIHAKSCLVALLVFIGKQVGKFSGQNYCDWGGGGDKSGWVLVIDV